MCADCFFETGILDAVLDLAVPESSSGRSGRSGRSASADAAGGGGGGRSGMGQAAMAAAGAAVEAGVALGFSDEIGHGGNGRYKTIHGAGDGGGGGCCGKIGCGGGGGGGGGGRGDGLLEDSECKELSGVESIAAAGGSGGGGAGGGGGGGPGGRIRFCEAAPTWAVNAEVLECGQCHAGFGLFLWKHHCRGCGQIFCAGCSWRRMALPNQGYPDPVRVCAACASPKITATTRVPTRGGPVTITGRNFGRRPEAITVEVAGCEVQPDSVEVLIPNVKIRCVLSAGTGVNKLVKVSVGDDDGAGRGQHQGGPGGGAGGLNEQPQDPQQDQQHDHDNQHNQRLHGVGTLSFAAPVITDTTAVATAGGEIIITGDNFGADADMVSGEGQQRQGRRRRRRRRRLEQQTCLSRGRGRARRRDETPTARLASWARTVPTSCVRMTAATEACAGRGPACATMATAGPVARSTPRRSSKLPRTR